jgi:hypothetical protein
MRRRKSADAWCQVNLRIKESLRAGLAAAAKEHEVSFNQEVRARLADSLEQKARQSLESLAADLERKSRDIELAWRRFEALTNKFVSEPPVTPLGSQTALMDEAERRRREQEEGGKS